MATNPQDPNNKHNSIGLGGRTNVGALSGQTRDATSLLGNAVFAETLGGIQRNAESRAADYDILKQEAQRNQSGLEKFGTALLSGTAKGITNGINGLVSLVPYPDDLSVEGIQNWNWDIASDDFSDRSMLSNYLAEGSKAIGLQTPIYSDNPYNFYTGLDAALTSVGEFAIPGKVISKGVGLAAKGVGTMVRGLGRTAATAGRMSTRARLAQYGARTDDFLTRMSMSPTNQQLFQSMGSGYLMNRFEGTVMGHQVYEEMMQELEPAINAGQLTKEEAQQYANQAALSVRSKNTAMMLTDVFAMYGIFKAKGMTRNLLDKPGFVSSIKNNLLNKKVWNPLNKAAAKNPFYQALVEGGEEVIQSNIQKQSKYDALKSAEATATSRVGKDAEQVYVPDSDSYYQRLKDNLFSKDAAFEGLIGFFAGPIQSVALEKGLGISPLLNNIKYKKYTKQIQALENQIKPGGTVTDLGKKLAIQEQIKDLKLKRAQETAKGAYEEQQEIISGIKNDIKNALKESIAMEDLVEEIQEKGVEGVEELLENTAFINTLVKHFQNGTTENLERMLKDMAEGKLDPSTFGPDTAKKASDLLTQLQELEKQWLRYYNYENKPEIFAAIQNEKEVDKAINRVQTQKEEKQAAILEQLSKFSPENNYSFDNNGNLVITPKSQEEKELEDDLPSKTPTPKVPPTNDQIREFYERLAEKQELDEVQNTQNTLQTVKDEVSNYINEITSGKFQRKAKKERKEREKEAERAAKRAIATQKSQIGERSKAKTKAERSAISNTAPKTTPDGKVKITPGKKPATPPPPGGQKPEATPKKSFAEVLAEKQAKQRQGTPENDTGETVSFSSTRLGEAIANLKNKNKTEDENTAGFTKASEDRSSVIQGTTDSVSKDSDSGFYLLSDPKEVSEGDEIEFRLESEDAGFATDPSTGRKGTVYDAKLRKKEIAAHENTTYGTEINEDQAADDAESIAIYHKGRRVGYIGSPLAVSSARRNMSDEEIVEEKENLRRMRAKVLAQIRNGKTPKGSINQIDPQFYSWVDQDSEQNRSIDVFDDSIIIGIAVAGGVKFQGNSDTLSAAANTKAKLLEDERLDSLVPGLAYAFIPVKKDKNGVTYYIAAPLINQTLNDGHVNTIIYALRAWAGGVDNQVDEEVREEASETLRFNIAKKADAGQISKLLNRFLYPYKSHPLVKDDQTRTYIYINNETDSIQVIENVGNRPIVRAEVKRGEQLSEETIQVLTDALSKQFVQFDLENINGMPYVITDQEGNIQDYADSLDFRNNVLRNTRTGMNPVPSVLEATGTSIFHKSPKVTFSVDGEVQAQPKITPAPSEQAIKKGTALGFTVDQLNKMTPTDRAALLTATSKTDDIVVELKAKYSTPTQTAPGDTATTQKEYTPEEQLSDEDAEFLDGLDDDYPGYTDQEDDMPIGGTIPQSVKDEYERNNIKGLTPSQNSEIVGYLANLMFRKLVEAADKKDKVEADSLYKTSLDEVLADMDSTISKLKNALTKQAVLDNEVQRTKYEKNLQRLESYKEALLADSIKLRELSLARLERLEGVKGHRSEEDLDNIEEVAHERRNFSENFFLSLDSKKSTSKALRKFLSNIPLIKTVTREEGDATIVEKAIPVTTSFGSPKYADFDSVYNKLHSLEVGANSSLSDQLSSLAKLYIEYPGLREELNWIPGLVISLGIDNVVGTIRVNGEAKDLAEAFLAQSIGGTSLESSFINLSNLQDKTGFGKDAGEKIKRQFAINMSKNKVKAPLVIYRAVRGKGGKITFEVALTDHNNSDNSRQVLEEMQESFLKKFYVFNPETEEYDLDTAAAESAIRLLQSYITNPPTQKNSNGYKDLRRSFIERTGIPISVQTFHALATTGYRLDKSVIKLNGKAKNVFKTEGTPFNVLLKFLEDSVAGNKPFNAVNNPFTDNALKRLASLESMSQTATLSNAFRVGDKTIYTYTEHNYASSQIQRILRDANYREKLQSTVFAGESLWLHLMGEFGNNIISVDPGVDTPPGIDIGILNFRPVKEKKESSLSTEDLDKQGLNDNIFTRLALFTANASKTRKTIQKKDENGDKIYSLPTRSGTVVPLTYSDKHTVLTVTTNLPIFTLGKGGGVTSDTINIFYEHVFMAEANRIFQMFGIDGSNDAAYDEGKSTFFLLPEMNTVEVADSSGETDLLINHIQNGALTKDNPNYDQTVVNNVKLALGNQLNALINEQLEEFQRAKINVNSKESEASFVSNDYVDMIKQAQKDAGAPVKEDALNKAIAADYTLNHMLATANMFQLFVKDPALYTKVEKGEEGEIIGVDHETTLENIQKRLAAVIAPGTATAMEEGNDAYIQLFASDVRYSEFLQDPIVDYFKGIKNPKYRNSYSKAEITDGQELITTTEYLNTMVMQGQITEAEANDIKEVLKNPDANIPDWMMEVLFGAEKPVAVADKFITLSNGKTIEKRVYVKSSGLPLIPKFTKGTELEKLRLAMEELEKTSGLPVRLAFGSAVKVGLPSSAKSNSIHYTKADVEEEFRKRTENRTLSPEQVKEIQDSTNSLLGTIKPTSELVKIFKGDLTDKELSGPNAYQEDQSLRAPLQVLERKFWRIQQATPSKQGDETTKGTQESKIILSEVLEAFGETEGKKIIEEWEDLHNRLFKLRSHKINLDILNPDGTIDKAALAEFLKKDAQQGGVGSNIEYGLQVDENGEYIIPMDLSPGTLEFQTLINAVVNKKLAQKKVKGQSTVLMTEFGFSITQGSNLTNSGIIFTEGFDFETGKLKPARIENGEYKPAQVILPNKFYIIVNGKQKKIDLSKYVKKGPQGQMILDTKAMPPEVLQGFSFRIPTQGYNSLSQVEIVGFLPDTMGDVVVAPGAFVAQMGSDFDIDKLYNYFYKLQRKDGKFQKVDSSELMDSELSSLSESKIDELEDTILNRLLDLRLRIMANENIYQSTAAPLDFGLLKYSGESAPFQAKGLPGFMEAMESQDEDKELGLKHYFKTKKAKSTFSSRNPLTPSFHTSKYQEARGAGEGVGVFARAITFQSMAQAGKSTIFGNQIRLGRFAGNNISDSKTVTNNKRSKIAVFTAFLSAHLDNEKEQIVNYLNINNDTFGIATSLIHSGFEEDFVLAFLESPILRAITEYSQSRTSTDKLTRPEAVNILKRALLPKGLKGDALKEAESKLIEQAIEAVSGEESESRADTFTRLMNNSDVRIELLPGKQNQLVFIGKDNKPLKPGDELKKAQLYALGSAILAQSLKAASDEILNAQTYLNIDSGGIGKNVYEAYEKLTNALTDAGYYKEEEEPSPIFNAIVGELRVLQAPGTFKDSEPSPEELSAFENSEAELLSEGYIRLAKVPGSTNVVYLKPNSASSNLFAEAMALTSKIYEDTMPNIIDFVLPNLHLADPAIKPEVLFKFPKEKRGKIVHETMRSILYSSAEDWISTNLLPVLGLDPTTPVSAKQLRELFAYSEDLNIATLVSQAIADPRFSKNPFLKSLITKQNEGERAKATYANFNPDGLLEEDKSNAFSQLFLEPDQSPIFEGGPTPAELGAILTSYALLTGGNQKALEYIKYVPNSYLVGTGFYEILKNKLNDLKAGDDLNNLAISIETQLIQHNPTNTYRKRYSQKITPIEGTEDAYKFTGQGVAVKLEDLTGEIYLAVGRKRINFIYTQNKDYKTSLYYFNPDINVPGQSPVLTRIDILGEGGDFDEFSADFINGKSETAFGTSIIPTNKRGYIEESTEPEAETEASGGIGEIIKKVKVGKTPGAAVSRKLELPTKGEADPVQAIQAIAASSSSPMFKQLAAAFLTRKEELSKVKFTVQSTENEDSTGGAYSHENGTVNITYSNDKLRTEYLILHEFGHALTKDAVIAFESGGTYPNAKVKQAMKNIAEVQNLYVRYLEAMSPEEFKAFKDKYSEYVRRKGLSNEEKQSLPPLDFSNREEVAKYYAGIKLSEFVTMVLSDEILQQQLDSISPALEAAARETTKVRRRNLLQEILGAIKDILEGLTGVKLSDYTIEQAMVIVTQGKDPIDINEEFGEQVADNPKSGSNSQLEELISVMKAGIKLESGTSTTEGTPEPAQGPRYQFGFIKKVISGGQTGSDYQALLAAKKAGYAVGGIGTRSYAGIHQKAKDLGVVDLNDVELTPEEEIFIAAKQQADRKNWLEENEPKGYNIRTYLNINRSDATVIYVPEDAVEEKTTKNGKKYKAIIPSKSPGSYLTAMLAIELGKPFIVNPTTKELNNFLFKNTPGVLNIAGSGAGNWTRGIAKDNYKARNKVYNGLTTRIFEGITSPKGTSKSVEAKAVKPKAVKPEVQPPATQPTAPAQPTKEIKTSFGGYLMGKLRGLRGTSQEDDMPIGGVKPGVTELFDSNPELANQVYEALGFKSNSIENRLQIFFNQFGFQFKEGDSSTDLLRKIIYVSKTDNNVFIDNSVKALSQLLLANTNIDFNKLENLIEDTNEFKTLLSQSSEYIRNTHKYLKDGNRIPMEEWVSYIKQYNKIKNTVLEKYVKESLLDKNNSTALHKLIINFLEFFKKLFNSSKNLKDVTDSLVQQVLLNQREVVINSNDLKNKEKVTLAKALKETSHGKDIIKTFGEFGLILTGSISAAEQGTVFRKTGKLLHDIDWVVPKGFTKDFNKKLKDTFEGTTLVREFDSSTYYTQTYIVPPKGYTVSNLTFFKPEIYGKNKYIASYDVLDKDGNIVSNYRRYYDVKPSGKVIENREVYNEGLENVDKNLEAVSVDFFQNKEDLKFEPYTVSVEGVDLQLSNWMSSFTEKLKYGRAKDLLDYANFIPNDVVPVDTEITPQQKQQAQQLYSQYIEKTGKQDIEGFKEFVVGTEDDMPVSDVMTTDLGMDITDFLKQLTPDQKKFYMKLFNEGSFTVKCRR